jgi:hypothetical protein
MALDQLLRYVFGSHCFFLEVKYSLEFETDENRARRNKSTS